MTVNRILRFFDSDETTIEPPDGIWTAKYIARHERHWWLRSQPEDAYMKMGAWHEGKTVLVAVGSPREVAEFVRMARKYLGVVKDEYWTADRMGAALIGQGGAL